MPVSLPAGEPFASPVADFLAQFTDSVLAAAAATLRSDRGPGVGSLAVRRAYRESVRVLDGLYLACLRGAVGAWAAGREAAHTDLDGPPDTDAMLAALRQFADGTSPLSFAQLQREFPEIAGVTDRARDLSRKLLETAESSRAGLEHAMAAVAEATGSDDADATAGRVWDQYLQKGLRSAVDDAGRTWELVDYAETAARTVFGNTAVDAYVHGLTTAGADHVTVSESVEDCPVCAPWEGDTLALAEDGVGPGDASDGRPAASATLAQARTAGLLHPNCRHRIRAASRGTASDAPDEAATADVAERRAHRKAERALRVAERQAAHGIDPVLQSRAELATARARLDVAAFNARAGATETRRAADSLASTPPPPGPNGWPVSAADLTRQYQDSARREALHELFEDEPWDVPGLGELTCDLTHVSVSSHGVSAEGNLRLDGITVARFSRSIWTEDDQVNAGHDSLDVNDDYRGHGIATAFNARLFRWYEDSGVDAVHVSTAHIGGYAWARAGFRFLTEYDADHVIGRLNDRRREFNRFAATLRRASRERSLTDTETAELAWLEAQLDAADPILDRAETHPFDSPGYPSAFEFASIGRGIPAPTGATDAIFDHPLGKSAMINAGWDGIKYLDGARSERTATDVQSAEAETTSPAASNEWTTDPEDESAVPEPGGPITVPIEQLLPRSTSSVPRLLELVQQAADEYGAAHPDASYRFANPAVTPEAAATTFSYNVVDTGGSWSGYAVYTAHGDDASPILELTDTAASGPVRDFAEAFALQWQTDADATPGLDTHPSAVLAGGRDPQSVPFLRHVRQTIADAADAFQYDSDANPDGYTLRRVALDVTADETAIRFDVIDEDDDLLGAFTVTVNSNGAAFTDAYPTPSFPSFAGELENLGEAFARTWNQSPVPDPNREPDVDPSPVPMGDGRFPILASDMYASGVRLPAVRAAVADVFEADWDGFDIEIASINQAGNTWTIRGDFIVDGAGAGPFTRTIVRSDDGLDVNHTYLHLRPEFQGRGIAKQFNERLFDWYRASGVRRVEVYAALDVGGYAWARAGFRWLHEDDANTMWRQLTAAARRYTKLAADKREQAARYPGNAATLLAEAASLETQAQAAFAFLETVDAAAWGSPAYPSPKDLSTVGMPAERSRETPWIGKEVLLSAPWYGVQWIDGT